MKRPLALALALTSALIGAGQNLVPNGSFEEYTACPTYFGLASWSSGWQNLYTQSADYFNACHEDGVVGVPLNYFGYQYPSVGDGYMGLCTYQFNQSEYREMVGIQLSEPLQVGVPVCLSFKLAVGGFGTNAGASAGYTCKGVGMKFFNTLPTEQYIYDYPNSSALYLDEVPTDTAIWYQVEGVYLPDSAYTYVVVGNFFADSLNQPTIQDSIGVGATDWAYAFIDDVRASFSLDYCSSGVSIHEPVAATPMVYPMPFTDRLTVHLPIARVGGPVQYTLRSASGHIVESGTAVLHGNRCTMDFNQVPVGAYLLEVSTLSGIMSPIPVVHVSP